MKSLIKFLLTAVMSLTAIVLPAQSTVYPIQINAVMMPPYTNCLGDYFNAGANRVQIKAILRDLYKSDLKFSLSVKVKSGNTVYLESATPYPIHLTGATLINDLGEYVKDLFSPAADVKGLGVRYRKEDKYADNGYCLPEGGYEFVFQVFDFYNKNVPLSEPFSLYCYLQQAEPPVALYPENGACGIGESTGIGLTENGVQFQWMDPIAIGPASKSYELVVTERNTGAMCLNMFSNESANDQLNSDVFESTVYNTNFYLSSATGTLEKGKEYCWYVKANADRLSVNVKDENDADSYYANYAYKNRGKSNVNCFTYGECPDVKIFDDTKIKKTDDNLKVELVSVDINDDGTATATWEPDGHDYCKYNVYYYRKDLGEVSADVVVVEQPVTLSAVLKNLEPGYDYLCYVIGVTHCNDENSSEILSPKSNEKPVTITKVTTEADKCDATLTERSCDSPLKELSVGSTFYGNTDGEVIVVKSLSSSDTEKGIYSGTGVVSCTMLKNKLGLNVTFDNITINSDKYLCKGTVEVVTSTSNNLMLNLNDVASKKQGADKADQQETLGDKVENKEEAAKHTNGTVIIGDDLYAVDAEGNAVEVGKVEDKDKLCELPQSGLDNEDGVVSFSVKTGLTLEGKPYNPLYYPYIDESASPFQSELIKKGYESQSSEYPIPWVEMVEGETRYIVATIDRKAKESTTSLKMTDVDFYCYAADGSAVKLVKKKIDDEDENNTVAVQIYGGTKNTSLKIYARKKAEKENDECSSENKTLGVLNVYTMSHDTKNILLVPVSKATLSDDDVTNMEAEVNKKFAPLGKTFKFTKGVPYTVDMDEELSLILENGLNIDEDANRFTKETSAMKYIRTQYSKNTSVNIDDYNACLFLIPYTDINGVQGYMPIGKSVGYIVVGSNNDKVELDANTIAHELCHGLYSIQHVFDYGIAQGALYENIMDYQKEEDDDDAKETQKENEDKEEVFRYLTKYFQWVDVEKERQIHLSFLDDTEDAEAKIAKENVEDGIDLISELLSKGESPTLDDIKDFIYDHSPAQVKAFIKTWENVFAIWKCGVSGLPTEYCLCNSVNENVVDMLSDIILNKSEDELKSLVDKDCKSLKKLGCDFLCELLKEIKDDIKDGQSLGLNDLKGKIKDIINQEFCNNLLSYDANALTTSKYGDSYTKDNTTCTKYVVRAWSHDKVRLKSIKFNGNNYNVIDRVDAFKNVDEYNNFIDKYQGDKNCAIKLLSGEGGFWSWIYNEIYKSFIDKKYYGENHSFQYCEMLLVNVCCSDLDLSPSVDITFDYNDKNWTNNSVTIRDFSCLKDALGDEPCEYKLTADQLADENLNLPTNAKLVKGSTECYISVNGKKDDSYEVIVTNEETCETKIKKCHVDLTSEVKEKFNLPKSAKLEKDRDQYYVVFRSDCCDFRCKAEIDEKCEFVNVLLDIPDYTIVDGYVYIDNKLYKKSDVTFPDDYFDCKHLFINGQSVDYEDYFKPERMKCFFIETFAKGVQCDPGYFEKQLTSLCNDNKLSEIWRNVVNGNYSFHNIEKIINCYSVSIDWDKLHNDVMKDLHDFSASFGCGRTPINCLLAKLISSMAYHLDKDYKCSENFIDDLEKYTPTLCRSFTISSDGLDWKSNFENSLSETLVKMFIEFHKQENGNLNVKNYQHVMNLENNRIPAFIIDKSSYSMPRALVNFQCGCK